MNYLESLDFFGKDEHWIRKMGQAALVNALSIVLVGWMALDGWALETLRRAGDDADEKLPGWHDWCPYLREGAKLWAIQTIWYIPVILLEYATPIGLIAQVPYHFLMCGAMIILAYTGDLKRAMNPINAWRALKPSYGNWLVVAAAVLLLLYLCLGFLWIALRLDLVVFCVLMLLWLGPWYVVDVANLIGRAYREYGATV